MCLGTMTFWMCLYEFLRTPRIAPPLRRLVVASSVVGECMSLYSLRRVRHVDFIWPCLVSVRLMIVGVALWDVRMS